MNLAQFTPDVIKELKRRQIARDPVKAIPRFLRDQYTGEFIKMGDIHIESHHRASKHRKVLQVFPRDHGKSQNMAVGRSAWEIGENRNIRIGLFSESTPLVVTRIKTVANLIKSPEYQELFPHITPSKDNWGSLSFTVERDWGITEPTMMGFGIKSAITGFHFDLIILDDVCGEACQTSGALRELVKLKYASTIINLMEPHSRLIIIGTFWHLHDLTKYLYDNAELKGLDVLCKGINDKLEPIWAEKWSHEKLVERRNEIGVRAFELNYQLKVTASEDIIISEDDLNACISIGDPVLRERIDNSWIRVMGVDLATREKTTADYTFIIVIAINPVDGTYVPVDIVRRKMTAPKTKNEILRLQDRWNCDLLMVENNAAQEMIVQFTKEASTKPIPIEGEPSIKDKFSKASILAVDFEHRKFRYYVHQNPLKGGSVPCDCAWCSTILELRDFPNAENDDSIDGHWFARVAANKLTHRQIQKPNWGELNLTL